VTALFTLYVLGCAALLVAGVVEQRRHHRTLFSIPDRVVVNGIRGKSSITRLCAGALRGGGLVTVAKTTGSAARFITPDGEEEPIYRKFGLANIVEQIGIVRRAAAHRPDVLVIECMAVLPDLQEVNERKLIRSTVCVISNVREDHLAEMGPTLDDVARSLARSMPEGGVCVTAERERFAVLRAEADRRRCRLVQVDPDTVTDAEMARFPWITFKENVAIALEVARLHGVGRAAALDGMIAARPDPGTVAVRRHDLGGGRVLAAANVFAANDPASTLMNVELLAGRGLIDHPLTVVINCRPDRVERNGQMGELTGALDPDVIVLIGEQTRSARVTVPPELADRVVDLGGPLQFDALLDALAFGPDGRASLVAVGNIHGQGEVLLSNLAALPAARPAARGTASGTSPTRRAASGPTPSGASPAGASRSGSSAAGPEREAPSRATPKRATPTREAPSRANPSREAPSRANPSREAPSRATPSRPAAPPRALPAPVEATRPVPARPAPVRPDPVRAEPVRPAPVRPAPVRPDPVRPDPVRAERVRPEPVRREPVRPDPVRPERVRREPVRPDPVRPERVRPDPVRPDPVRPDPVRPERVRAEPVRRDPGRRDPVRRDPARPEPGRSEPAHRRPAHREPVEREPVRREPTHRRPAHREPERPEPARSEPVRREPAPRDRTGPEPVRPEPVRPAPPRRVPPPRSEAPDPEPLPAPRLPAPRLPAPLDPDRRVAAGSIPPRPRVVHHPPRPRGASRRS
jgi:poly-gamma-glutamate synthase PgsB/CapB